MTAQLNNYNYKVCHDWSMGDVWLLAFITAWLSFNASKDISTNCVPLGTYATLQH